MQVSKYPICGDLNTGIRVDRIHQTGLRVALGEGSEGDEDPLEGFAEVLPPMKCDKD
jgi:hypothetical protein